MRHWDHCLLVTGRGGGIPTAPGGRQTLHHLPLGRISRQRLCFALPGRPGDGSEAGLVTSCWGGPRPASLLPWCHQDVPLPSPRAPCGCCLLLLSREASPSHLCLSSWGSPGSSFPLLFPRPFHHGFPQPLPCFPLLLSPPVGVISLFK